jgi:prepilin-type N-terminal cleavage/methylation domain-containing protein
MPHRPFGKAFTLIELLVVVAIIAALLAILLPSMGRAVELTHRAVCASNLHQFHTGIMAYASDHHGILPPSRRDDGAFHTRWISTQVYNKLLESVGSPDVMRCPNMDPVAYHPAVAPPNGLGYRLGSLYLGGFKFGTWNTSKPDTHPLWVSPQRLADPDAHKLLADFIYQPLPSVPNPTAGAHGRGGLVLVYQPVGIEPSEAGVEGANLADLDGGVVWRPLHELKPYSASPDARARNFH